MEAPKAPLLRQGSLQLTFEMIWRPFYLIAGPSQCFEYAPYWTQTKRNYAFATRRAFACFEWSSDIGSIACGNKFIAGTLVAWQQCTSCCHLDEAAPCRSASLVCFAVSLLAVFGSTINCFMSVLLCCCI